MSDKPFVPPTGEQPDHSAFDDTRSAPTTPGAAAPPTPPTSPPPVGPPEQFRGAGPTTAAPRPRRLAASVIVASLVLGGAAGFGGAAAWNAWDDDDEPASSDRTTSQVDDSDDEPAAAGSVEEVAAKVLPSVVKIDVTGQQGAGSGSGIVLSSDGQILTNDHVVSLAEEGGQISVSFSDGSRAAAEIVGTDSLTDIAVIQAQDVEGLTPATLGNSADLDVGEEVVAVGSPYGLDATVTSGIVSALNRPVDVGQDAEGNTTAYPAIQTDAAINPGNSGGPLVDMEGNVVGINSSIRTSGSSDGQGAAGGSIGLGFAIPIDAAMPIVEQIAAGDAPTHARLGITVSEVPTADGSATSEGALVREVSPRSAAGKAGLEAGDVITRIDDHTITGPDSLIATIRSYRPGDTVSVTYERDGETATADLKLDSDATS